MSTQVQQQTADAVIGASATVLGWLGIVYRVATEAASDVILWGNVALVLGGVYLMWPKIRRRWRESRSPE